MSMRTWLKSPCLVRIDYSTDHSLDFVKDLEIYSRSTVAKGDLDPGQAVTNNLSYKAYHNIT